MRRYAVSYSGSVSGSAATATQQIGLVTGSSRLCQIYEAIFGQSAVVTDAQIRMDLYLVSALTAGSALTPQPLDSGSSAPAAVTGASSTPTSVTTTGLSLLPIAFNSRATIRWAAVDPDSRISIPAGGGAAGSIVLQNQQPGTVAGLSILANLYFVE